MKWLDRTLVQAPFYYGLCTTEKGFLREVKRLKVPSPPNWVLNEWSDATTHFLELDGKVSAIVCIRNFEGKPVEQVYGLLVHEASHIWQEIKRLMGEGSPSAEFEAYSIQRVSQNLMNAFKELTCK